MNVKGQRGIAARLMKVGYNRVWVDPEKIDDVSTAITRREISKLIKDGVIDVRPIKGVSRGRAKLLHQKRKKSRRRGPGSREGSKNARFPKKERWMKHIRALRKRLNELAESKTISISTRRILYRQAKGGTFKSIAHMMKQIDTSGLLRRKTRQ